MKFIPISDNVVVKSVGSGGDRTTKAGLYIPQTNSDGVMVEGLVLAKGDGRYLQNGVKTVMTVDVGDTVWFPKFNAQEIEVDGEKFSVVSESYILGFSKK